MPQTGTAGSRQAPRDDVSLTPAIMPFDPVGEITAVDRRGTDHAAAAEEFAARFGLDHGVSPVQIEGRLTVTITGRGAERYAPARRRVDRRSGGRHEQAGFRADRAALWAVALGLLLIFVAATSAHAATLAGLH